RADAFFDLVLGFGRRFLDQVDVRPRVRTNRMTRRRDLPENLRMPDRVLADREERRLGALGCKCSEHGRGVDRPRTIVEGQDALAWIEKVIGLEVLKSEAWTPGRVDLHHAGNAKCPGRLAGRSRDDFRCRWPRGFGRAALRSWPQLGAAGGCERGDRLWRGRRRGGEGGVSGGDVRWLARAARFT